jgi:hypothetical protein
MNSDNLYNKGQVELDLSKLGLRCYLNNDDVAAAKEIIYSVVPSLKGKTFRQIEIALEEIRLIVSNSFIVEGVSSLPEQS